MLLFVRHGKEAILCISSHISNFISSHDIGVYIDRINRIRNQYHIVVSEQISNISGITLGSVRYKDISGIHINTVSLIVSGNGISGLLISLLRAVSFESLCRSHGLHSLMQCIDDHFSKRKCHIADSQADDLRTLLRILLFVCSRAVCNLRKEIACLQIQIIFI